jgi:pimeloyl-ACP methyl ester carboxylesterase
MNAKRSFLLIGALLVTLALAACGGGGSDSPAATGPVPTDYSQAAHWLSLPVVSEPVDVFYLYPTAWSNHSSQPAWSTIDDPSMLAMAPLVFERQAAAFEAAGNVFAPFYRQYNSSAVNRLENIAGIPTLDAVAAFDHYIKHLNNGRPFILVGHSQGATVLTNLLAGYMKEHPAVLGRMVAAYVVGYPISDTYLAQNPHLTFATSPDDTGVIVSWNTEAPVIGGTNPVLYGVPGPQIHVINPINWKTDTTPADSSSNSGSIQLNADGSVARDGSGNIVLMAPAADAQIDSTKGVVICSTVDVNTYAPAPPALKGIFHAFDIPFYYYNVRTNAVNRANKYLATH